MSYLANSTHFNNWIFTPEELSKAHRLRHVKAKKSLRLEREKQQSAAAQNAGSIVKPARKARSFAALLPMPSTAVRDIYDWNDEVDVDVEKEEEQEEKASLQVEPLMEFLSLDQEALLRDFYEEKIQESCSQLFRTSDKVKSSAVMLYKRFYLSNSVMEFHPKFIVPTAIYVAGKVEEQYISVDTVAEQLNVDHKHVIGHEMILLEGVRFQLIMYHPFRSLLGFVDDLRAYRKAKSMELPLDTLQKLHSNSCVVINELLVTDLPLLYSPAYLALAALCRVADELGATKEDPVATSSAMISKADVVEYIQHSKFAKGQDVQHVLNQLEQIEQVVTTKKQQTTGQEADEKAKQIKKLYKKLKKFHEDEDQSKEKKKDDKKRKADKEEKKKAKKQKKEKK